MATTIKEIAKLAKVSIATVSRALNDDKKVKSSTKKLIKSIANELNYNPNLLARSFVTKKSNIIGLVMPDIFGEFFMEIIRGVDEICYNHGYYTMVTSSHSNRSMVEAIVDYMSKGIVGGLILMTPLVEDDVKKTLASSKIPLVVISGKSELQKWDSISIDNFNGAYSVVDYLAEKGYKKIAHISGPQKNNDSIQRELGYRQALKNNGIEINKSWIVTGDFTINGGQAACETLMKLENPPEVIFASNDMMAIGCYVAARHLKLKIPVDFAVAGFDDIFVSQFLNPRLTSVHVPIYELGTNAAQILINRMNGNNDPIQNVKILTELIVGGSC
ncbi:MAG: LacI family DNA-binding transcriptional regulator [Ignavibacteria bacterium]|nr:LacI family DNA-binding transcriptional regulator [Ignavibacteria bacterium]